MAADLKVSTEIDWSALGVSDDLNWDAILISVSVNVSKNFLKGVKRLLGG